MPFINIKTNTRISETQEIGLKEKFGEAVSLIGKSENWLMVNVEDTCRLYFRGEKDQPIAFVEVCLFGKASGSAYDRMTSRITDIVKEELDIDGERVYVQYEECDHWGYNGYNF